ncbi:MAG: hypothetical protein WDW36_003854 [Sanguina aurantia]
MSLDVLQWAKQKLQGEWSAPQLASQLNEERLQALIDGFGELETMLQVRLLIAGQHLSKGDQQQMLPLLQELLRKAGTSQHEWLKVTAAAMGGYQGPLDSASMIKSNATVKDTMGQLSQSLEQLPKPAALLPAFQPAHELFLHPGVRASHGAAVPASRQHQHFTPRDTAEALASLVSWELSASAVGANTSGQTHTPAPSGSLARRGMGSTSAANASIFISPCSGVHANPRPAPAQPSTGGSHHHHHQQPTGPSPSVSAHSTPAHHSGTSSQRPAPAPAPHKTHQQQQQEEHQQRQQLLESSHTAKRQKMQEAQARLAAAEKGGGLELDDIDALFD